MIVIMKYLFGLLAFLLLSAASVQAYELSVADIESPYDVVVIGGNPNIQSAHLGELDNFPIMYEVVADSELTLTATVRQPYQGGQEPLALALIAVRDNDDGSGVTEVARLRPTISEWEVVKDSPLGLTFWESESLQAVVEPGIYRIEVSSPVNQGRYLLFVGAEKDSSGYWQTLGNVRTTQKFFGYSFVKLLTSTYVYYPLGILLILFAIHRTWKCRKTITHVD